MHNHFFFFLLCFLTNNANNIYSIFLSPMGLSPVINSLIPYVLYTLNVVSKIIYGGNTSTYLGEHLVNYILVSGFKNGVGSQWDNKSSKRYKDHSDNMKIRLKNEQHTLIRCACSLVMHFNVWAYMQTKLEQIGRNKKIPVLCLWGDQDLTLPNETRQFKQLIPHAKVEVFKNHTHMFAVEYGEKVAQSIQKFWLESNLLVENVI